MAQINYTVTDVIVNSLYLIGELGVGETPDAFMLSTGLELINELLNKFSSDSIYIPYLTNLHFIMVPGQDTYSVSDIAPVADIVSDRVVDLSMGTYTVNSVGPTNVIYPLKIINKATYYGVVRQGGLQARPGFVLLDKQATESFIIFYPAPDQPYPCDLKVKVMLNDLGAFDHLTELPPYYYGFLKYALARKFRDYYPSSNWTQTAEDEYMEYFNNLKNANETDVTIRPSVILDAPQPFYWPNILAY
jgi:hypothetical protein